MIDFDEVGEVMIDFDNDGDGVKVLWEYEDGWLVYEYTELIEELFPSKRSWVGHRCQNTKIAGFLSSINGFVSAEMQHKSNICGWCNTVIPPEVQGVVSLYNYGKQGEQHDES
jgi:hypothetical protein